ncbi:TIGR00282 family metallophosphoesterase [Salinicoccus sp. RF5]|uniref:TIGR00282 family metallophosphoesterase n=1 Tax=Salinicoccus sp. RF5 TaxID=2748874 RepID=UPI001E484FF0|nr:TIGR00282 family metallophosphoesterase [Salinicoccus sp. RF5]MCC4722016.1 TIGR00282 family metallophosphoesterase [Salinicoccus sp. RF5]
MRILFIGDIVGKIGRRMLKEHLLELKRQHGAQVAIVNGENAAHGKGITEKIYKELLTAGADFITLGNHAFAKRDVYEFLDEDIRMIRPANFPEGAPGRGHGVVNVNGVKLLIMNLQGRSFMNAIDCPFRKADGILEEVEADEIFVDFHSETTSESLAMGHYLDGRVDAVVGTHTHVQTNDEQVLPEGTKYITDVGMTGFRDGILGIRKEEVIERFLHQMPVRHNVPEEGPGILSGVIIDTKTNKIDTIRIRE